MVSARLPEALVSRMDYVVRNSDGAAKNRSAAFRIALEQWLPAEERRVEYILGTSAKKSR